MKFIKSYIGVNKDGISGIWHGEECPKDIVTIEKIIDLCIPDDGKVFVKDGQEFSCLNLTAGEKIEDYEEVDLEELEEESQEI